MQTSEAHVVTVHGDRYIQQLAKHWGHKFPVEATGRGTVIDLPLGRCTLDAAGDRLHVALTGRPDADMPRFQQVVAEHLQRFGFRETLVFDWQSR